MDIDTNNETFTWNNRCGGRNQVPFHLDRFFLLKWLLRRVVFVEAIIFPCLGSDHWPIKSDIDLNMGPKLFRFEIFWL